MLGIILFSIVLIYFIYRGFCLGLGLVLARIASLIGAYILALSFAANGAALLTEKTELQGLAAYFIAGFAIFVISWIIISIVLQIIFRVLGKLTDGKSKLPLFGAIANGFIGAVVGLVLVWIANIASTALNNGELPPNNPINNFSQQLMGGTIDTALTHQFPQAPQLVGVASYVLQNPTRGIQDGLFLANDPDVKTLINSKKINRMVEQKNVLGLMNASEINAVLDKETVQRIIVETNVLGDVDVTDKTAVKMRLTEEVMTTLIRVETVKQNSRFKQLTSDPELSRMVNNGDVVGLMASPKAKEIAQIIMDSGIIK
jgi:hypothetical protein